MSMSTEPHGLLQASSIHRRRSQWILVTFILLTAVVLAAYHSQSFGLVQTAGWNAPPPALPFAAQVPLHAHDDDERVWCYFDDSSEAAEVDYAHNFTLPGANFLFRNRVSNASGLIVLDAVAAPEVSSVDGEVRVNFNVTSRAEGCTVNICLVRNAEDAVRVVVYPRYNRQERKCEAKEGRPHPVDVQASVVFANPHNEFRPLQVGEVEVITGDMSVRVGDLARNAVVQAFTVEAANANIRIDNLNAHIFVGWTMWGITATVTAWSATFVHLESTRGIRANLTLSSPAGEYAPRAQFLSAAGPVEADIALGVADRNIDPKGIEYSITAAHNLGPLRLNVLSIPSGASLALSHSASYASHAEITVPPTFEGSFTLSSDTAMPLVKIRSNTSDPEDRGRQRTMVVEYDDENHVVGGETYWGARPNELRGYVISRTFDTKASLSL